MVFISPPNLVSAAGSSYDASYHKILATHRSSPSTSVSSVVILVAPDVDALCAARILVMLFRQDDVMYQLRPVSGVASLVQIKDELAMSAELHTLILINIGALLALPDPEWFANFSERLRVHVIDSTRPQNLSSLFGVGPDGERIIVWDDGSASKLDEERKAWEALEFEPDLDSDEEDWDSEEEERRIEAEDRHENGDRDVSDDEEPGERPSKRRRLDGGSPAPMGMSRRTQEKHHNRLNKYYRSGTWYGQAASGTMYVLATVMERTDNDMLWLAILGLTYQYTTSKISREMYESYHTIYLDEVARLNPSLPDDAVTAASPNDTSIRPSDELRFALFRHWNLYDAMYHSSYVASKLGTWKEKGRHKLQGLLAKMGFSLQQCQQSYIHMDMDLKRQLRDRMESIAPEYGLVELSYPSFLRNFGFKSQALCAADVVDGVSALLEAAGGVRLEIEVQGGRNGGEWFGAGKVWSLTGEQLSKPPDQKDHDVSTFKVEEWWEKNFWTAFDALGNDISLLHASLSLSIALQRAIIRQGASLIDKHEIKTMRTFRMALIKEGPDLPIFCHPGNLSRLALWLVEALRDRVASISVGSGKKKSLPLVVACLDERAGSYIVVGVIAAPELGDIRKNEFGLAFLQAKAKTNARTRHGSFDTSVVEVSKDDLQSFMLALQLSGGRS